MIMFTIIGLAAAPSAPDQEFHYTHRLSNHSLYIYIYICNSYYHVLIAIINNSYYYTLIAIIHNSLYAWFSARPAPEAAQALPRPERHPAVDGNSEHIGVARPTQSTPP